jgi:pimeloyl-ACP methyl ester carboxylesterase
MSYVLSSLLFSTPSGYSCDPMSGTSDLVRARVLSLPRRFRPESANGLVAEWELRVGRQSFTITVEGHACAVSEGPGGAPQAVVSTGPSTWLAIDEGRLPGEQAFLDRRLAVRGNLDLAVRLQTLFRRHRRPRRASDLDQVEVRTDGLTLSCYMIGKGPEVVLLHGLGGTKITWLPLLARLGAGHRVIVPDLPGHGESGKPRADYTPRFYARVIRRLLDRLDADRAVLVGNSLGGRIALQLAVTAPARVKALALLAPALPGFRWRHLLALTRVLPAEIGAVPFPMRERWMRFAMRRLFADPGRLPPEGYAAAAAEFARIYRDPAARMAFFATLRHIVTEPPGPFYASLRRLKQPVLLVFGDRDRLVPARLGITLARELPRVEAELLTGVGHVPQFEAPEATLRALEGFLVEVSPPAGP